MAGPRDDAAIGRGARTRKGRAMKICIICRFATEADDVAVAHAERRCICLRCYGRETGMVRPMPKPLQRKLIAVLSAIEVG
jgi:hypothetical protein